MVAQAEHLVSCPQVLAEWCHARMRRGLLGGSCIHPPADLSRNAGLTQCGFWGEFRLGVTGVWWRNSREKRRRRALLPHTAGGVGGMGGSAATPTRSLVLQSAHTRTGAAPHGPAIAGVLRRLCIGETIAHCLELDRSVVGGGGGGQHFSCVCVVGGRALGGGAVSGGTGRAPDRRTGRAPQPPQMPTVV